MKLNQRLHGGLTIQGSYTYSKIMTDADRFSGSGGSLDAAHPELEWSVGRLDQTHSIKISTVYELPFGSGRKWLQNGWENQVFGGWRLAVIQAYASGLPIAVTSNAPLPIFNGTNRPNVTGADLARADCRRLFDPTRRQVSRSSGICTAGRRSWKRTSVNGDVRRFWNLNET